jgi:hypothetical protein
VNGFVPPLNNIKPEQVSAKAKSSVFWSQTSQVLSTLPLHVTL